MLRQTQSEQEREQMLKQQAEDQIALQKRIQDEEANRIKCEKEKMQIELEHIKKQMQQDEERQKKAMADLKKQYETKL